MIIRSKTKDYRLDVVDNVWACRDRLAGMLTFNRAFYFVDAGLRGLYENQLNGFTGKSFVLPIEADERNKSYLKLADYYRALIEAGFTRNDVLVTFGGGILQDISGFIASTLYRGLKWVYVPTTLLAQADSCIGSKTSINFGDVKNLIGTFYPPDIILLDPAFTRTLKPCDLNSGLGEIIKFHLLSDPRGYARLNKYLEGGDLRGPLFKDIIFSTLKIKKSYFESDEFDTGRRNLLNYGHCFGHALESASHFGIAHGEAVMVGMSFANLVSMRRGLMKKTLYQELHALLVKHYPRFSLSAVRAQDLVARMKRDKKRTGTDLTIILLRSIGEAAKYHDLTEEEFGRVYQEFLTVCPERTS